MIALLNLILLPLLAALGLFETPPPASGGTAGAPKEPDPPATGGAGDGKQDDDAAKPKNGEDEELGEAGVKALEAFKARARTAEKDARDAKSELERLRSATQTDVERTISEARKEAETTERKKWEARVRRSDAKSALASAGANDVPVAVAAFLDEHSDLKINDEGDVEDLDATVETFKKAHPTLFTARVPGGSADQGAKPPAQARPATLEDALDAHYRPAARPS